MLIYLEVAVGAIIYISCGSILGSWVKRETGSCALTAVAFWTWWFVGPVVLLGLFCWHAPGYCVHLYEQRVLHLPEEEEEEPEPEPVTFAISPALCEAVQRLGEALRKS